MINKIEDFPHIDIIKIFSRENKSLLAMLRFNPFFYIQIYNKTNTSVMNVLINLTKGIISQCI